MANKSAQRYARVREIAQKKAERARTPKKASRTEQDKLRGGGDKQTQESVQIRTGRTIKQQRAGNVLKKLRRRAKEGLGPKRRRVRHSGARPTSQPRPAQRARGWGRARVSLGGPKSKNAPIMQKTHRKPPGAYEYGGPAQSDLNIQLILFAEFITEVTHRIGGSKSIFVIFERPKSGPTRKTSFFTKTGGTLFFVSRPKSAAAIGTRGDRIANCW